MVPDWTQPDLQYLRKQLEKGAVSIFAGAGFSVDSLNRNGKSPPLSGELAQLLASKADFPYSNEPLPIVYEAVRHRIGSKALNDYLQDLYKVSKWEPWYNIVKSITWHRIYTINIDDLFQCIYSSGSQQRLETIVYPADVEPRDQLFQRLQCIHLHGQVDFLDKGLTFTLSDIASHTVKPNPWYQAVVDDLYRQPFIFIGTILEEPQFSHYLVIRETRVKGSREFRSKSFLINPSISPIRAKSFQGRNIFPIQCTAAEFFTSLQESVDIRNFAMDIVRKRVFPHVTIRSGQAIVDNEVNRYFDHILPHNLPECPKSIPGLFFLGAEPTWDDIAKERDGNREINSIFCELLKKKTDDFSCFVCHGPAGSGKTTTLMRVAYTLSQEGYTVFFAKGLERIELSSMLEKAKQQFVSNKRFFVFIDVMRNQLGAIDQVRGELKKAKNVTLVLSERTNLYYKRSYAIQDLKPQEMIIPNLSEADVNSIVRRLDKFGFLGALRDKTREERVQEFMIRASRQLLVAMKEATSGKGFDVILSSEFHELHHDAQLPYLICCIAVASGAPGVYRRHLLPCLGTATFKKAAIIDDLLRGILIPANQSASLVKPRHRLISQWITSEIASPTLIYEATSVFLKQISSDIVPNEIKRRSPAFLAYRGMINSDSLWETLRGDEEAIFALYEDLKPFYGDDFLFWLHYSMVYIKAGHLDLAENYLNQSLALRPNSFQTLHQLGILYLLQATNAPNPVHAKEKADEGIALLKEQIYKRGDYDSYPYAAYLTYVARWYSHAGSSVITQQEWEELRSIAEQASNKYPRDDFILDAAKEMEILYLSRVLGKD